MTRLLAMDIGGANIKCVGPTSKPLLRPFKMWRNPHDLSEVLFNIFEKTGRCDLIAVTMTGELCECFETKAEGVRHILASVKAAVIRRSYGTSIAGRNRGWPRIVVWRTDRKLAPLSEALEDPLPAAAANWLALATLAGRVAPRGRVLLLDIGSTTADLIPIQDGVPVPSSSTDTERLLARELVYTGVLRTPITAVVRDLPFEGRPCAVAAELFATTRDAYLLLEELEERPSDIDTADGRPATRSRARDRMARMICADRTTFDDRAARAAALHVQSEQTRLIREGITLLQKTAGVPFSSVVISGLGEFLARRAVEDLGMRIISLSDVLGNDLSTVAPAYALWCLAGDNQGGDSTPDSTGPLE